MRRMINVTNISLDGVMERMEDWHFDYTDADMDEFVWATLEPCDTLVIGRRSYEGFAAVWPSESGPIADRLNSMRKILVSRSMASGAWANTEVYAGDLAAGLAELKATPGGDVISYGFGPIMAAALEAGLLDELHLLVNPVLAGKGNLDEMLIREGAVARFAHTATRAFGAGAVALSYRPR